MEDRRPSSIFRSEALEHHARQRGLGDVLRVSPWWSQPVFAAIMALVGLGLVASMLIRVGDDASGPAQVQRDGTTVEAVLPAGARSPLAQGQGMELVLESGQRVPVHVSPRDVQPTDPASAIHMFGADALSSLLASSTSLVLVRGTLSAPLPADQTDGLQASVQISSEPLLTTVLSGFAPAPSSAETSSGGQ